MTHFVYTHAKIQNANVCSLSADTFPRMGYDSRYSRLMHTQYTNTWNIPPTPILLCPLPHCISPLSLFHQNEKCVFHRQIALNHSRWSKAIHRRVSVGTEEVFFKWYKKYIREKRISANGCGSVCNTLKKLKICAASITSMVQKYSKWAALSMYWASGYYVDISTF